MIPLLVLKGKPLMWQWSCVLMRLVTQRSVAARREVASQSSSQPAKTLLLFSVCSARLYHSQPSAALCGCTSTLSIIHRPTALCKQGDRDAHQLPLALNVYHCEADFLFNPVVSLFLHAKCSQNPVRGESLLCSDIFYAIKYFPLLKECMSCPSTL